VGDPGKIDDLRNLIEQKKQLEQKILKVAQEVFPIGGEVTFGKGRGWVRAIIIEHADHWWTDPSFKIRNVKTDREYWIDLYWLIRKEG
jgi:hypothetical protein